MATKAQLQAQLEAAKKRAAAATKAYQNTPSYAENYAQIKQENDSAINALDKIKSEFDSLNAPAKKQTASPTLPTTDTTPSLDELQNELNLAVTRRSDASNNMDMYSTDSPEYAQAKADFAKYTQEANDAQQKITEARSTQQAASKAQEVKFSSNQVEDAQKALAEATQKAKDKNIDPTTDPKVQQAQKNLDAVKGAAAKAGAGTASTGTSGTGTTGTGTAGAGTKGTGTSGTSGTGTTGTGTKGTTTGTTGGGTTSGGATPVYSKTVPKGAVGVDASGNWVDAKGRIVGTSVPPAVSMMPKGAVGIEGGNWVDAKGNKLGSATPSTSSTPGADAYAKFKQQYGSEAAIIESNPDLKAAFNQAINAPGAALSVAQFQALYENSNYYKNSYSSYVSAEDSRLARPGEYVNQYNKAIADIKNYAAQAGISLDWSSPDLQPIQNTPGAQGTNPLANKQFDPTKPGLIDDILHKFWDTGTNQTAITQYLATKGKIDPTIMGGAAQNNEEQLRAYAADLGLSNLSLPSMQGGDYFTNAATQIAQGGLVNGTPTDLNYWKQDLKNKAKAVYGGKYDTQLDAGQTIKSLAAPYINTLTGLLESSPDTINLSDPNGDGALIRNAMQKGTNPEEFAKQVMSDPRWLNTKNAKSSLLGIGNQFLSAFGLSALG